jgi:hypothetical protein
MALQMDGMSKLQPSGFAMRPKKLSKIKQGLSELYFTSPGELLPER